MDGFFPDPKYLTDPPGNAVPGKFLFWLMQNKNIVADTSWKMYKFTSFTLRKEPEKKTHIKNDAFYRVHTQD